MKPAAAKFSIALIAVFSLLLVAGAMLTALAETGFTAPIFNRPTKTSSPVDGGKPTITPILLATKEKTTVPEPTEKDNTANPTSTPKVTKTTDPDATKTAESTATKTPASTSTPVPGCTTPEGWVKYKVQSGDTLYSIALLYQSSVPVIQSGNCMGSATTIITGDILYVPNNPTLTPTPKPTNTPKPTSDGCNLLNLIHLGNGTDPAASPANSTGCPTGKYKKGEAIALTSKPDSGWEVIGWLGTDNDSSTATTNSLTMPDKEHTAKVKYGEIAPAACYPLTVNHSGNGGDPTPSIPNSTGCPAGKYIEGETITLTAYPDPGNKVSAWSGTDDDTSTATTNTVTFGPAAASVTVTYAVVPPCFTLTLSHSGAGADPVASPTNSSSCPTGMFLSGESISLTAAPTGAGVVTGWTGTDNDSSASLSNTLTMPGSNHVVSVTYAP